MKESKSKLLEKVACVFVFLMAALQGAYAIYAYIDPVAFSIVRGTELASLGDTDWVQIYASRTLFVSLIIGLLLYLKNYKILVWAALFGTVMPITDAYLAYEAHAENKVVYKHIATVAYLLITFYLLKLVAKNNQND
tara:strand:- start:1306 stop:1716 length:411 start_codon:yes stop_codon:yes gene_type:complete